MVDFQVQYDIGVITFDELKYLQQLRADIIESREIREAHFKVRQAQYDAGLITIDEFNLSI